MPEAVIPVRARVRDWTANVSRMVRRVLAFAIAAVGLVLAFAAAGVIALAALAVAVASAAGIGLMWLWARITGRPASVRFTMRRGRDRDAASERRAVSDETLEARRGPRGWTVETERPSS